MQNEFFKTVIDGESCSRIANDMNPCQMRILFKIL